jgi:hypothetical protein
MKKIWGENAPYYSQRNNLRSPSTACGITSMINCLSAAGYAFPVGVGQPEDRLFDFAYASGQCQDLYDKLDPRHLIALHEWQRIIELATNLWMQKEVAHFDEGAKTQEILDHIVNKGPCVITGAFPGPADKVFRHSVAAIGVDWAPGGEVNYWYLRDPWGDHRTLYRDIRGNMIDLRSDEFHQFLFNQNSDSKWCIYVDAGM